jgi:ribosomal protein S12 methylthiotransferase accessory factor YcaO
MTFDQETMRLSVRMADHSSVYCAVVWTKSRVIFGGPAMLASGKGATKAEARAKALASLKDSKS